MSVLRTGVVGVGHMGINHARICSELDDCTLSAVYDKNHDAARYAAKKYRTHAAGSLEEFAELVDAATICTPTVTLGILDQNSTEEPRPTTSATSKSPGRRPARPRASGAPRTPGRRPIISLRFEECDPEVAR